MKTFRTEHKNVEKVIFYINKLEVQYTYCNSFFGPIIDLYSTMKFI